MKNTYRTLTTRERVAIHERKAREERERKARKAARPIEVQVAKLNQVLGIPDEYAGVQIGFDF
jgi:hypothetical protein